MIFLLPRLITGRYEEYHTIIDYPGEDTAYSSLFFDFCSHAFQVCFSDFGDGPACDYLPRDGYIHMYTYIYIYTWVIY